MLCSTEGPPVDFLNPINPIEKLDGALQYRRELRFYNSEVCFLKAGKIFPGYVIHKISVKVVK